jgi:hypothetical protein
MAQNSCSHVAALTNRELELMLRKVGRLFTIKTRWEAWLVIYAIALGAVERGRHYLDTYPGWQGWLLAAACTGVVFIAGAKLLDAVRPVPAAVQAGPYIAPVKRRALTGRSRPMLRRYHPDSGSRISRHRD